MQWIPHSIQWILWSRQQKDDFSADFVKKVLINIIPAEWVVQRSPDFFPTRKRCDGYKMFERHCRAQCWTTPLITHAVKATMLSLTPSFHQGWVYQHCPEYLTENRAPPWDLICAGVHLLEVVEDYLHIMSHLHPGTRKTTGSLCAECVPLATLEPGDCFATL